MIVVFPESPVNIGDGRSHATKAPPTDDPAKPVGDQLIQTSTSTNTVVSAEIKTLPKNDQPSVKGEAVPVLTDEDVHAVGSYSYKITSDGSTRPTGDLSTWILLGGESSPSPLNMATIKKVPKPADTTPSSFVQTFETSTTRKRKPTTERTSTTHIPVTESLIKLQDSKFKNKTPVIVGKIPTTTTVKDKVEEPTTTPLPELPPLDNNTRFGTPVVTFPHVPPRQRPSANNTKKLEKPAATKITSTAVVISKPLNSTTTVSSTAVPSVSATPSTTSVTIRNSTEIAQDVTDTPNNSTVKNTSLKKKKKKKNKNKRRPVKTSHEDAQSKIDDQATKITANGGRPLSTRIYNYLAREVMPNVGVGLVGLMLTAGLAGLLLYSPLGGAAIPMVPLRRTDNHVHGHSHGNGPSYVPPEADNSQPEEQVFGQVLSGMSYGHNPYGRERPDAAAPKYKPTSYQSSEYPAAHDVPKYDVHETSKYSGAHDAAKYAAPDTTKYSARDTTKYATAAETTKYSTHDGTKYAVVESTKYTAPDTTKYSAPDTSKYSTIDVNAPQDKASYPSLDASQDSAFDQTQDSQDQTYQNHHYDQMKFDSSNAYEQPKYQSDSQAKGVYEEDQSSFEAPKYPGYVQDVPKEDAVPVNYSFDNHRTGEEESSTASSSSDPTFAALQGVPKFYDSGVNSEQISVNVHQTMKMEHGPRSLRMKRQVDEHNEIDGQLPEETTPRPAEGTIKTTENQTNDYATSAATSPATTVSTKPTVSPGPPAGNPFSFIDFLRRVAEVKLKMGLEILKNTAASITQYVNAIQKRMTHMVRNLQKSNDRQYPESKREPNVKPESAEPVADEKTRQRRSMRHRIYTN